MAPYIYTERNGIYIIDLQKTVKKLEEAYNFVRQLSENGESILYTVTGNTVTGPEGSWQLTDEQCDQLIELWSGEETP